MRDIMREKQALLEFVDKMNYKYELSKTVGEYYFEPGMMENLEQYKGVYDESSNTITIRTEAKGLRYENRTYNLEKLHVGDYVQIVRDKENLFNSNNFNIQNQNDSLGCLPAELCNVLAPLYDTGYAKIVSTCVSYLERLNDRSRYAKQGVMFLEMKIQLQGI